ncbi:MAG: hypothetical protein JW874_02590 [Spirochaetales bacterium]|nr:hypothetical protein [Spirochaetales bacterium]
MEKQHGKKILFARNFVLVLLFGAVYLILEVILHVILGTTMEAMKKPALSLVGHTSLWMWPVGGLLGFILGKFNETTWIRKNCNVFLQSLLGALLILAVELLTGLLLNRWLNLQIWDHSRAPLNFMGQITLPYGVIYFLLCPFVFWLDDTMKFYFYGIGNKYNMLAVYADLFRIFKKTAYQEQK